MSEVLSIYLAGSAMAVFLGIVSAIEGYFIAWATKDNILRKNLNKIENPTSSGFKVNAGIFFFGLFFGAVLSWLGVLQYLWQIVWMPIKVLRELLTTVPEEIKLLSFPLKNNPSLSREAVFAYFYALRVKAGGRPDAWQISEELKTIADYYPSFDKKGAIQTLGTLRVIDKELISNLIEHVDAEEKMFEIN